ncbi:hypothetical protein LX64_01544 [Chitinophaga skermanii]|uniref:HEAT repeat protein n=1 Tax=Chitinophaga skermanii TaxID=331697 RepID=A0A327QX07_9BACT|nr:hypothetical protein [Chitinophaga skermanii]RAJ08890.1 hypothetical protein LX64_01544 [Chitinophaga skermanii]
MSAYQLNRLNDILHTTSNRSIKTYALHLVVTYHVTSLTTEQLFSYIPFIWEVDLSGRYNGIRHKIEQEIIARQEIKTIKMLLALLESTNPYLRHIGADLLNSFNNEIIVEPILHYLHHTTDGFMTKRAAIYALSLFKHQQNVRQYILGEMERNASNKDAFFRANYLTIIEAMI